MNFDLEHKRKLTILTDETILLVELNSGFYNFSCSITDDNYYWKNYFFIIRFLLKPLEI